MKKLIILFFYLFLLIIGFMNKEFIIGWIQSSHTAYIPFMFVFALFISIVPIIPFTLFAGLMGFKYGLALGFLINWFGAISSALLYYLLARWFLGNYFKLYILRFKGTQKFNDLIEQNAFLAILMGRMILIIPPVVINVYSGINRISFGLYFFSTTMGTIPPMILLTFGGNKLFTQFDQFLIGISFYILFILVVLAIYQIFINRLNSKRHF